MMVPIKSEITEPPKKAYSIPKLDVFGSVTQLTQSDKGGVQDDGDVGGGRPQTRLN